MASPASWIQASRPLAVGNVWIPVIWGAFVATRGDAQGLAVGGLLLACVWAWLDQLFIVFANDLADAKVDALGEGSWVSGGSRVLVQGKLSRAQLRRAASLAALCLVALSFALCLRGHSPALLIAAGFALALMWAYSFPPLALSYGRGGMALQALGMGVVLPWVGWTLQGADPWAMPWLATLAPVALAASSHLLTALPDVEADTRGGKRTRVVRVGEGRALVEAFALMALACVTAIFTQDLRWLPAGLGVAWVGLNFALARRFVRDSVGRLRSSLVGLFANTLLWFGLIWALR